MTMNVDSKIADLKDYLKNIEYLDSTIALLHWDSSVNMPIDAVKYRSEMIGYLSGEHHKLTTDSRMKDFIDFFGKIDNLDDITTAIIDKITKEYRNTIKIPAKEYTDYAMAVSISESAWEEAKNKKDFSIFKPHLEAMITYNKKFTEYWGFKDNRYNGLLDIYEPGITTEKLDVLFKELRDAIIDLLDRIKNSQNTPNESIFKGDFPKEEQKAFGINVLKVLGYDLEKTGRVDESMHPFTTNFGNKDVRITTNYDIDDFRPALFSLIHEGGHGIYEQNIPDDLQGTLLGAGASMGIHESQSRLYENVIGRSMEFWNFFYPQLQNTFSEFKNIDLNTFYKGINFVKPSLIRIDADELTYSIHVIIRYEIEKLLINQEINMEDIPKIWNEKYKEYLGVEPKDDGEGVLQDVHWAGGSFGYFPSYALGNLYGAQFLNKLIKDIPNYNEEISNGNLDSIRNWVKENVHKHGAVLKPADLIKKVTGEELTAKYFIEYLNEKYTKIYKL